MNKRIDPKAALDATARHLRQALRNEVGISTSAEMRTTFSVDRDIHDALRLLAARHRCKLNDLVAIAVEDLLAMQGALQRQCQPLRCSPPPWRVDAKRGPGVAFAGRQDDCRPVLAARLCWAACRCISAIPCTEPIWLH
jgi:hypothetical protein